MPEHVCSTQWTSVPRQPASEPAVGADSSDGEHSTITLVHLPGCWARRTVAGAGTKDAGKRAYQRRTPVALVPQADTIPTLWRTLQQLYLLQSLAVAEQCRDHASAQGDTGAAGTPELGHAATAWAASARKHPALRPCRVVVLRTMPRDRSSRDNMREGRPRSG